MKVFRFFVVAAVTLFFASCRPNGIALDHDILKGTPTKADTVLPHKHHLSSDTLKNEKSEEDVPNMLRR